MAEYIEREAIINKIQNTIINPITPFVNTVMINLIKEIPTADVVEVVRCCDCEYLTEKGICEKFRQRYPFYPEDDFHCGYGKRKEGAEE